MRAKQRIGAALTVVGLMLTLATPVMAGSDGVCAGLDSGKIDVSAEVGSVTITAPDGYLIDGYCVKAGSESQGNGPEYVSVDPPAASVTIAHTSGKNVSHYAYSVTQRATTTTTVPETTTTTVPSTCDEDHVLWNPLTQDCELPYTGVSSNVLWAFAGAGIATLMMGAVLLVAGGNMKDSL